MTDEDALRKALEGLATLSNRELMRQTLEGIKAVGRAGEGLPARATRAEKGDDRDT